MNGMSDFMKKKIGIVSLGYAWLPCEPGPSRFYDIAKIFAENGYEVDLIGSSFQHYEKKPKDQKKIEEQHYPFHNVFIEVPPYKKNIDLRRVYSNKVAVKNVMAHLKQNQYDIIYNSIPANNISAQVGEYCKENHIPYIIDVEDLWPEAMKMVCNVPVVSDILFHGFKRDAERAYACADAVIGTSKEYTNRAFKYQKRDIPSYTIYVGCNMEVFDKGVQDHSESIEKEENEFWITYAGSIGTSYDIKTLVQAGKSLLQYPDIKIKILGTGPLKEELEQYAKAENITNVEFLGYVAYPNMAAYLAKSDVLINSFVKGAPQSIVNKVGDYLSAGKPMINTLENEEFMELVEEKKFGVNIEPENEEVLAKTIKKYYEKKDSLCVEQGCNARKTAEECFDRKRTYLQMVKVADKLLGEH